MLKEQSIGWFVIAMFALCAMLLVGCHAKPRSVQNRLSQAASPYLREHADNPVDWYEWGDAALDKARKENKPLLISIGYAACHWCHQMEEESFMDTAVARLMNENFVCIKVDREERPDLDNLYLHACQLLNKGEAGWPLNAIALPDGKPFFAGTYYAKERWLSLLQQITITYRTKFNKVQLQANALTFGIIDNDSALIGGKAPVNSMKDLYQTTFHSLYDQFDLVNGGIKGQQKFPLPLIWEFALQYYCETKDQKALAAVTNTLQKMALGGLYDQVGGGFARYATDTLWRLPHFEKMLCDNAQLISLYSHAYQVTRLPFFKTIAEESLAFIARELTADNGGFYCSLNADTKSGEGDFYKWTNAEFQQALNSEHASLLNSYFNLNAGEKNVLFAAAAPSVFAAANKIPAATFNSLLAASKATLLEARNKRTRPTVDNKIVSSWNGLMLQAYADAYVALGNPAYLKCAEANALFLQKNMIGQDGQMRRSFINNQASVDGFLDDYAFVSKSLVRLYEVSFDKKWLLLADQLCNYAIHHFYDSSSRYFFFTANTSRALPVRKIELFNNIVPASNAAMASVLHALGIFLGKSNYLEMADKMIAAVGSTGADLAFNSPGWMGMVGNAANGFHEIAIMGKDSKAYNLEMQKNYLPGAFFIGGTEEDLPLLKGKLPAAGTLIYVCTNQMCLRPTAHVMEALAQLDRK